MVSIFQRLVISRISPLVWKWFPARKVHALRRFAAIERDSAFRFLQYTPHMYSVPNRVDMFIHALEEFHHADLFENQVDKLDRNYVPHSISGRKFVITESSSAEEIAKAYGYAHIGETYINKNFFAYNNPRMPSDLRNLFSKIAKDELRHAHATDRILMSLCDQNKKSYETIVNNAKWKRRYEEYANFMTKFGQVDLKIIFAFTYFVFGALSVSSLRRRFRLDRTEQLEIFKSQVIDANSKFRAQS